jgi:hypothetical protein
MGAMARLMQKSGMPFSNAAKGNELEAKFKHEIARIGFQADRGHSSSLARPRVKTF